MNKTSLFMILTGVFLAGWAFNSVYAAMIDSDINARLPFSWNENITNKAGPQNHILEDQIHVYKKGIVLSIENATWARFTDTHSMDPLLNKDSNGLEIKPESESQISIGDIISYESEYADGLIIHRVIAQGSDKQGWYVIVKGDNLPQQDPGKIRFSQIHGILVGVIY